MGERVGRGSLSGTPRQRDDNQPCCTGAITIERELVLRPGDHLHIAAWLREVAGARFLSLAIERAEKGRRR
jgi:hypothetical protein